MNIESKKYPIITLSFTNAPLADLDVRAFAKSLFSTEPNPYSRLAEQERFEDAYISEQVLVFPAAITAMVCSGDFTYHDAVFTEKEILTYLTSTAAR